VRKGEEEVAGKSETGLGFLADRRASKDPVQVAAAGEAWLKPALILI
jgi:hypothetical protein